jgi:hypothetical protein
MIITGDEALITTDPLSGIGQRTVVFNDFPDGRLAAERQFGIFWQGLASPLGKLRTETL